MNFLRASQRLWIASLTFWLAATIQGADFVPPENPPRFLIIVEKSDATQAAGLDIPQTMFDLVYRGANGRMPDGSVFEIWVFGAETVFRGFTPQMLTPNNHLALASRASGYVRSVASAGTADVSQLVEHLHAASELGQEFTILLVTAPNTRLRGTRRDAEINGYLDAHAEAQHAARRPFITAMRIQDGQLAAATVNDSPFTMTMPEMPASALTPEERLKRIDAARQARQEREQPAVLEAPAPNTAPIVATAPPKRNTGIPDEEWEGAIIIKGSPRPAPPPAEVPATNAAPTTTAAPEQVAPNPATETQAPASADAGTVVASENSKAVAAVATSSGAPAGVVTNAGGAASPVTSPGNPVASVSGTPPVNPTPAAAVPARTWLTAGGLFVAGLSFFVVAGLLFWVLMRRARAAAGPSYITRSLEDRR